jgi:AcrR family transcriptional regulator
MHNLARELGAAKASVSWSYSSKEDLLAALVEVVTKEMYCRLPPIGDGRWEEEIFDYFVARNELLGRVPVYREVFGYCGQAMFLRSGASLIEGQRVVASDEVADRLPRQQLQVFHVHA